MFVGYFESLDWGERYWEQSGGGHPSGHPEHGRIIFSFSKKHYNSYMQYSTYIFSSKIMLPSPSGKIVFPYVSLNFLGMRKIYKRNVSLLRSFISLFVWRILQQLIRAQSAWFYNPPPPPFFITKHTSLN